MFVTRTSDETIILNVSTRKEAEDLIFERYELALTKNKESKPNENLRRIYLDREWNNYIKSFESSKKSYARTIENQYKEELANLEEFSDKWLEIYTGE